MATALTSAATADDVAEALDRDGYAVVEGVLSREEAAAKRGGADADPGGDADGPQRLRGVQDAAHLRALREDARVRRAGDASAGPGRARPRAGRRATSSARQSASRSGRARRRRCCTRTTASTRCRAAAQEIVLNTMWALDDFTEANGATRVVPGSHKWLDQRPDASTPTICAEMPAGSVMFFTGSVFHGGGANHTRQAATGHDPRVRRGLAAAAGEPRAGGAARVVRTLEPRLQELLGYNIHPPFMGYVDGRHPRKVLEG